MLLNPEFATEEDKQRIEEHANDFSMAEPFFQVRSPTRLAAI